MNPSIVQFNQTLLDTKLEANNESLKNIPEEVRLSIADGGVEMYQIHEKFLKEDQYWTDKFIGTRFDRTLVKGILYRSNIVDEIVEQVEKSLQQKLRRGIFVKGPQGIGKSHSLVNTVRQLLYGSGGKYLVTFISDCETWRSLQHLLTAICASFNATTDELGIQLRSTEELNRTELDKLIDAVDTKLKGQGRQWVFVFDQVNKLFSRFPGVDSINGLPFPFDYLSGVMGPNRITAIISASANNEIANIDRHAGFGDYDHCLSFSREEILIAFPEVVARTDDERQSLFEITGGMPLQVQKLISYNFDLKEYETNEINSIVESLRKLRNQLTEDDFTIVKNSALACLFSRPMKYLRCYDRKHTVPRNETFVPVHPLVLSAYREFFWDDVL